MIEVLVAAIVLVLGALATYSTLSSATVNAQRAKATQIAVARASVSTVGSAAWMSRPVSSPLSTTMVVPGAYLPRSRCSARTSSIMFWMTRRSGLAP